MQEVLKPAVQEAHSTFLLLGHRVPAVLAVAFQAEGLLPLSVRAEERGESAGARVLQILHEYPREGPHPMRCGMLLTSQ
jgi:hypothetical protein